MGIDHLVNGQCRFAGLANGFSKEAENHAYSVAIHFMHYDFVRILQSSGLHRRWRRE
jgi:hypothetical protein